MRRGATFPSLAGPRASGTRSSPPAAVRSDERTRRTTEGDAVRRCMTTWILGALVAAGLVTTSQMPSNDPGPLVAPEIQQVAGASHLKVVQRNVDGRRVRFNSTVKVAKDGKAQVLLMQEVCQAWLADLPEGWRVSYATTQPGASNHCPETAPGSKVFPKGVVAIWTKSKKKWSADSLPLEGELNRTPAMACVHVKSDGVWHDACSTHLVAFDKPLADKPPQGARDIRVKQATQMRDYFAGLLSGKKGKKRRVVVGGDFNHTPGPLVHEDTEYDPMGRLYAVPAGMSKGGQFTEGSQLGGTEGRTDGRGGAKTVPRKKKSGQDRKIDYIFFSNNFVGLGHPGKMTTSQMKKKHHSRLVAKVSLTAAAGDGTNPRPAPCTENECFRAQLGVQDYVYNENTRPSDVRLRRFVLDRKFYARAHPDVMAWAQEKVRTDGGKLYDHVEWHWRNRGITEGRMGSATFDPPYYLSIHPDVAAAYGATNYLGAIEHYVAHGQHEGRRGSIFFDVAHYKARYADIAGASNQDAMKHFTVFGMSEGRQGSADFGPAYYMGTNPDLQQAYGANHYRHGMSHWIAYGRAEGRPGAP
ncbi:hypothetical protein IEQ44_05390 [Nocardioides sp. Y6]|uniref:Endonuclease/exonuclease/phosphatase domain-containing protein n=1 Tax=Nocardioides malaquae TaxID=2773426 RepID=A0ABR9RRB6_9ACTN|nr:endonuclease/exonuclease/phosphatase family protein [Nocardioides malaquae]MBE7324078.1 hypothetical protein [Nocardioides malaquae]